METNAVRRGIATIVVGLAGYTFGAALDYETTRNIMSYLTDSQVINYATNYAAPTKFVSAMAVGASVLGMLYNNIVGKIETK